MISLSEFDKLYPVPTPQESRIRAALAALKARDHADLVTLTAAALTGLAANPAGTSHKYFELAGFAAEMGEATLAEIKRREGVQDGK